jgi:hypothetical protein
MADILEMNCKHATSTSSTWSAGAAQFTVALGNGLDNNAYLLVNNTLTNVIVRVNVKAGDGDRSVLGDLDVDIAASSIGAVRFSDSMRHKTMTTGKVTVNLRDTADTALTAGVLAGVKTILLQG